jgi:hydroxypyruvate isomerase
MISIPGLEPAAFIYERHSCTAHVHIADHPAWREPETGTIKFATQFEALDAVSYAGSFGFEDVAATTTKAALTWRNRFPSRREQSLRWGTHRIT